MSSLRTDRSRLRRLIAATALLLPLASGAAELDLQGRARGLLEELVGTNTTHAYGSTAAATLLAARFREAGFAAGDVLQLAPPDHPTKGNLVVRLHGRGTGKPILYLCHLDVVEARREDWNFDPFRLTEQEGWLYGRGTIDMKGQDAAVAAALIEMRRRHIVPGRDLIVAFTADEEAGGDASGIQWLLAAHRDLIDADYVVNPDGGDAGMKHGRRLYVAVQTSEKLFLSFELTVTDKGGHSSEPTPANPIYRLAAGLERLSHLEFPVHLTPTTRAYFARRASLESGQLQADMRSIAADAADAGVIGRLSAAIDTAVMLRTTCTATLIDGGHAENALPQRARATIQCRVMPGESTESVAAALRTALADPTIAIDVLTAAYPAPESPPRPELLTEVEQVTGQLWPGVIVLPELSPGASDSTYTRAAGIPSYGIDGMFDDLDDGRAHGRDERIGIVQFRDEVEFTYRLMQRLAR
jgi:acetylornithine deacetylase/succinyl-diaminopimelate desuccinylase-like protein